MGINRTSHLRDPIFHVGVSGDLRHSSGLSVPGVLTTKAQLFQDPHFRAHCRMLDELVRNVK